MKEKDLAKKIEDKTGDSIQIALGAKQTKWMDFESLIGSHDFINKAQWILFAAILSLTSRIYCKIFEVNFLIDQVIDTILQTYFLSPLNV